MCSMILSSAARCEGARDAAVGNVDSLAEGLVRKGEGIGCGLTCFISSDLYSLALSDENINIYS